MCEFCDGLKERLMDPKFRVILERDRDPQFRDFIYRHSSVEPGFCFGELDIINEKLYLCGDEYEPVYTVLNYCPQCGEPLEWAKNKVAESIEKNIPVVYRGDDYNRLVARDTFETDLRKANLHFDSYKVEDGIDKYYFDNDEYRVEIYQNGQSKLFENKTNKERRCEYSIYRSVVSQLVDIHKYEKHK